MATRRETSAELNALKEKVDDWRRRRDRRTRIPEELWEDAVKAAENDGLWATSRATRFHYPELKQRMARARRRRIPASTRMASDRAGVSRANGADAGHGAFVELSMDPIGGGKRTVVELVGHGGDRIRVESVGDVDLAGLARAFFGRDGR